MQKSWRENKQTKKQINVTENKGLIFLKANQIQFEPNEREEWKSKLNTEKNASHILHVLEIFSLFVVDGTREC